MKPVLITWGFSPQDGKPYLDCYLEVDGNAEVSSVKMMELRGTVQGTKLALLKIPRDCNRKYIEEFIEHNTTEVIELLNSAFVRSGEITRCGHENQAIDFITCRS